jgi:2-polyprenyl-3-methyl-5-hydroxy-6-metoxy-1,4-benzoquinol methylase
VRTLRRHGVAVEELVGVSYRALAGRWERTRDLSVNYMGFARKSGG